MIEGGIEAWVGLLRTIPKDVAATISTDLSLLGSFLLALPLMVEARRLVQHQRLPERLARYQTFCLQRQRAPSLPIPKELRYFVWRGRIYGGAVLMALAGSAGWGVLAAFGPLALAAAAMVALSWETIERFAHVRGLCRLCEGGIAADSRFQLALSASHNFGLALFLIGGGMLGAAAILNHLP